MCIQSQMYLNIAGKKIKNLSAVSPTSYGLRNIFLAKWNFQNYSLGFIVYSYPKSYFKFHVFCDCGSSLLQAIICILLLHMLVNLNLLKIRALSQDPELMPEPCKGYLK